VTPENWNSTFVIPVSAVIDYKAEDDPSVNVSFTLKYLVDGQTKNSTKIPVSCNSIINDFIIINYFIIEFSK